MPRGFIGNAAAKYLRQVSNAHESAVSAGMKRPSHAPPGPRGRRLPFGPEDAFRGSFTVGHRNSSNIVTDREEYAAICNKIDQAEDRMGECLHKTALEIEAMCQTIFVLPRVVPRCVGISDAIKQSLNQFRSLTLDAIIHIRNFARDITDIG